MSNGHLESVIYLVLHGLSIHYASRYCVESSSKTGHPGRAGCPGQPLQVWVFSTSASHRALIYICCTASPVGPARSTRFCMPCRAVGGNYVRGIDCGLSGDGDFDWLETGWV